MTPDDLDRVRRTWSEIACRRTEFLVQLEHALRLVVGPATAGCHGRLLLEAADDLVDVLATPSQLAARAATIGARWPTTALRPRLDLDGAAWRRAASRTCAGWTEADESAWRCAWLLLADVVADVTPSPFEGPPDRDDVASRSDYVAESWKSA